MAVKKEVRQPQTLSRGWGDDITWVQTYEEGLYNAKKRNKPLMVIHHLEDCQYCLALKKAFAENEEIQKLAQESFIMLNLMHETTDKNLAPDGQYVPRVMFVDPSLTVRADITGRYSNRLFTYEPQDINICTDFHLKTDPRLWRAGLTMYSVLKPVFVLLVATSFALAKDEPPKATTPRRPQTLSRGWGDSLDWTQTYEEALTKAKKENKPLMLINHRDDCPHSQALKKAFAEHRGIQKLAEQFILINVVYDPTDKNLSLDGEYVPKIVFVDPSLVVRADIPGKYSNHRYTYEPEDIDLLFENMKKAMNLLKTEL
ncbi:anterior gradient protein 2-A-like [Gastrophryne carolinensis]